MENKLLHTQIIIGLCDKELQARLLRENLKLNRIVKKFQAMEQAEINRQFLQSKVEEVYTISNCDQVKDNNTVRRHIIKNHQR